MNGLKTQINNIILLLLSFIVVAGFLFDAEYLFLIVTWVLLAFLTLLNIGNIPVMSALVLGANLLSVICTILLYDGIGVILIFLTLLMTLICFNSIPFSQRIRKNVHLICGIGLMMFFFSASSVTRMHGWLVFYDRNGTLINNNTLGILVVGFCFSLLLWNDMRMGRHGKRLIAFCVYIASFTFAFITGCRSAMLVLLLYLITRIFVKNRISDKAFRRFIVIILVLSLMFPILYVALYQIWPNVTFMGKTIFSGRQLIWIDTFDQITRNLLFGSGTAFEVGKGFESVHNMLLGIWKNVGLIPLISTVCMFVSYKRTAVSQKQQLMIISMLIFTFFETFMMDINFLLMFSFLMIGDNDSDIINIHSSKTNEEEVLHNDT